MLIRCTHCNHELRVPDQQISPTGTRVLCKNCNTIFVARRAAEEGRGAAAGGGPEILPVADDPALEAALDRILDRTPLPGSLTSPNRTAFDGSEDGEDTTESGSGGGADPWAQVSPESLGISLVDDEPEARIAPPASEPRARPSVPAETGDGEVDELLDQVLRDLDRAQPSPSASPAATAGGTAAGDALRLDVAQPALASTAPAEPPPMPTTTALDLDAILDELRSESDAAPATSGAGRASDSFELGEDDFGGPTIELEIGSDTVAKAGTANPAAPAPESPHERERSLHDIYEDDQSHPPTDALEAPRAGPATDLARAAAAPTVPPRTRTVTRSVDSATGRRASGSKGTRSRSAGVWIAIAVVLIAVAAGAGIWYVTQQPPGASAGGAAQPAGMPTFAFEQTDGQLVKIKGGLAYVASGVVRNTSSFTVYVVRVSGVLRTTDGREVGRAASYAGNNPSPESLTRLPRAEIEAALDTRIGEGGSNVKLDSMGAIPFTLVFWNVPSDANRTELSAQARSFPSAATNGG